MHKVWPSPPEWISDLLSLDVVELARHTQATHSGTVDLSPSVQKQKASPSAGRVCKALVLTGAAVMLGCTRLAEQYHASHLHLLHACILIQASGKDRLWDCSHQGPT